MMALMARKIKDSGRIVRETLVKEVVSELQVTPWTVANYIALAKKNEEVLGFILDETRGDNGEKFLHPLEG